jgi:hypothetical protein
MRMRAESAVSVAAVSETCGPLRFVASSAEALCRRFFVAVSRECLSKGTCSEDD